MAALWGFTKLLRLLSTSNVITLYADRPISGRACVCIAMSRGPVLVVRLSLIRLN